MLIALKILLIGWFITENYYIQQFIEKNFSTPSTIPHYYIFGIDLNTLTSIIKMGIYDILSCLKCFSFWITLLITFNIWIALSASFIAFIFEKTINKND